MPSQPLSGAPVVVGTSDAVIATRNVPPAQAEPASARTVDSCKRQPPSLFEQASASSSIGCPPG